MYVMNNKKIYWIIGASLCLLICGCGNSEKQDSVKESLEKDKIKEITCRINDGDSIFEDYWKSIHISYTKYDDSIFKYYGERITCNDKESNDDNCVLIKNKWESAKKREDCKLGDSGDIYSCGSTDNLETIQDGMYSITKYENLEIDYDYKKEIEKLKKDGYICEEKEVEEDE